MALHRSRIRRVGLGAAALAALGTGACEFPATTPKWQTKWEVPAESATVAVANFLPAGVLIGAGGTMLVSVPAPGPVVTTLLSICGASCNVVATIPVPAFNNNGSPIGGTLTLPASVTSAALTAGQVDVGVTNNFTFDPIKPAGSVSPGTIRIKLTSGATIVADTTISSANGATILPATTTTFHVALKPGTISGNFSYQVTITCPGSATTAAINPANSITVTPSVTAPGVSIGSAVVTLVNQAIADSTPAFDLSSTSIDPTTIQNAALVLRITNPFQAGGAMTATMTAPGVTPVTKPLTLTPAAAVGTPSVTTSTINFTSAEIGSFLGHAGVKVKYAGTVSGTGAANTLTVTPTQKLGMQADLRASIFVGGK
jgi:hypothetical protein